MSHLSKIFESVPVKVQNKNGFDLSHLNCGTSKCGQLVPVMCKLLPPNSDFTLGVNLEVNLPPLAAPFYGRVDAIIEGFVVPCSILYGGWKQFISNNQSTMFVNNDQNESRTAIPVLQYSFEEFATTRGDFWSDYVDNDNIYEYLGLRLPLALPNTDTTSYRISLLPALAYHLIWDTYYRNKQVTKTIFDINYDNNRVFDLGDSADSVSRIWHSRYPNGDNIFLLTECSFPDGINVWHTRQRNWARDYFTASTPSPQQGAGSKLKFSVADASGEFSISALRSANALQKFLETNNLSGDYADMMRNRWGTRPIDADFDEPYYLGRVVVPVYQHSVYQQDSNGKETAVNPFAKQGAIGVKSASASMSGSGSICSKYHNTTWSYVMCIFSLVPHAMYGQGVNRELTMIELGDFPAPELQSVGNEAIKKYEVLYDTSIKSTFEQYPDFSYIPRYSRFKYMDDEVHAELRSGKSLDSFVLQRNLSEATLSTSFLEIPTNYLDDVFAVSTASMNLSCWYEIYFDFKVAMPLADFCIPTLGDIGDTHTIKTTQGGSRL